MVTLTQTFGYFQCSVNPESSATPGNKHLNEDSLSSDQEVILVSRSMAEAQTGVLTRLLALTLDTAVKEIFEFQLIQQDHLRMIMNLKSPPNLVRLQLICIKYF